MTIQSGLYLKLAAVDVNTETLANVAAIEAEKMGISRSLLKAATINARQLAVYLRLLRCDLVSLESGHREDKEKLVNVLGEILNCLRGNQNILDPSFQVRPLLTNPPHCTLCIEMTCVIADT